MRKNIRKYSNGFSRCRDAVQCTSTTTIIIICLFIFGVPAFAVGPYTDNTDNTVTDTTTNLRWQKCSMGQTQDASCTGTATKGTWPAALQYCKNLTLAGKTWRLPSLNELKSLVDKSTSSPSIKTANFPATVANAYWSSSTYVGSFSNAWSVSFNNGSSFSNIKTASLYVRCVTPGP